MPEQSAFDYAIVRLVPYVERGEFINVGVIVFCATQGFLASRVELDRKRLRALAPDADIDHIKALLDLIPAICEGAGPIGHLCPSERFHWLISPRSTVVQVSEVHSGLSDDLPQTVEHLMDTLVRLKTSEHAALP